MNNKADFFEKVERYCKANAANPSPDAVAAKLWEARKLAVICKSTRHTLASIEGAMRNRFNELEVKEPHHGK